MEILGEKQVKKKQHQMNMTIFKKNKFKDENTYRCIFTGEQNADWTVKEGGRIFHKNMEARQSSAFNKQSIFFLQGHAFP